MINNQDTYQKIYKKFASCLLRDTIIVHHFLSADKKKRVRIRRT